jgi:hypothetical protein
MMTEVPSDCTAHALTQAMAQTQQVAPLTAVVGSQFACVQGYAKAIVQVSGAPTEAAYFQDQVGTWSVLSVGKNLPASQLGIPEDIYNELNTKVPD